MLGFDAVLGFLTPFLPYILGAAALIGAYFGIKAKGKAEGRDLERQAQQQAKDETQARLDTARGQDAAIDQQTAEAVGKVQPPPTPPEPPPKAGDPFQFCWLLLLLPLLAGCATVPPVPPVAIDIPAAPLLQACPEAPHPRGTVEIRGEQSIVALQIEDAKNIQVYLRTAPPCYQTRELLLRAWAEKLVNRLKAVSPGQ